MEVREGNKSFHGEIVCAEDLFLLFLFPKAVFCMVTGKDVVFQQLVLVL